MGTVAEHVRRILPAGTRPKQVKLSNHGIAVHPDTRPHPDAAWELVPYCPADCFAAVAWLVEMSGAYHHVRTTLPTSAGGTLPVRNISVPLARRRELTTIGRAWSLMLPFVTGTDAREVRAIRLRRARHWLALLGSGRKGAGDGHSVQWFDEYFIGSNPPPLDDEGKRQVNELEKRNRHIYERLARLWLKPNANDHDVNELISKFARHDVALLQVSESQIQEVWDHIWNNRDERVVRLARIGQPPWWEASIHLVAATDEACVRMGLKAAEFFDWYRLYSVRQSIRLEHRLGRSDHALTDRDGTRYVKLEIDKLDTFWLAEEKADSEISLARHVQQQFADELGFLRAPVYNFAGLIDYDIACVFPKSRKPSVGCTIRNLTNHLALLPGRGVARAYLRRGKEEALKNRDELNLLLIPFPFRISSDCFQSAGPALDDVGQAKQIPWAWFEVKQRWMTPSSPKELARAIDTLLSAAERDGSKIHAIVFPELALDYATYAHLVQHIAHNHQYVDLLISGVSEIPVPTQAKRADTDLDGVDGSKNNEPSSRQSETARENPDRDDKVDPEPHKQKLHQLATMPRSEGHNCVATTTFMKFGDSQTLTYIMTFQPKHHRWKLNESQVRQYQIDRRLRPEMEWWEAIETTSRKIEFTTFRGGSTVVALACEDLARLEPCQELIRSIGPNLVIALLMDGAQKIQRWSARYATVLADDPGSSTLTLTSLGLMSRTCDPNQVAQRIIGLWKDDLGTTREIAIPGSCHAAVLRLRGERSREVTLDGRDDGELAISWRFAGALPITDAELQNPLPGAFLGAIPANSEGRDSTEDS